MSAPQKPRLPRVLRDVIDRYRRRWRAVHAETGLFATFVVLAATVGAAVAADRLLRLSPTLRAIALGVIAAAAAACLVRWVLWPALRRMGDRDAAARLGHHYPKVEEDLVSAVELSADEAEEQGISVGLIRSALHKIAGRAQGVDYRRAVSLRPLLKAGGVLLVLGGLLAGAYLLRPEAIRNALLRLVKPSEEFFSYTKLQVAPGDRVVRIGDEVEIVATTTGRKAEVARLYGRRNDGSLAGSFHAADRVFVRLECQDGVARWPSGPLFKSLRYRVSAGDAISAWHHVRVVPPPSLTGKGAVLRAPDYAGGRITTIDKLEGQLQVVGGTQVTLRATPATRGADPEFRCTGELRAGDRVWPLAADEVGVLMSQPFVPEATCEYVIALTDGFGLSNRTPEGLLSIKVTPDRVPVVSITKPGRDLLVLAAESVPVVVEAHDEFGLRDVVVRYRVTKNKEGGGTPGRWQEIALSPGGPDVADVTEETKLNVEDLGLAAGDRLEYSARASDYADEAILRRGYSPTYRITVLSDMEHLEHMLSKLKDVQLELRRRAAVQKAQASRAGSLADKAGDAEAKEGAREAQQRELEEVRATEHLARKLERLVPELARNPSTPTDMLSQMERLGRGIRSVARDPMTKAADEFARAAEGKGQQGEGQKGEGQKGEGQKGEGQQGQPQQGQQGQQGQRSPLRMAQEMTNEASRRLE
ncbi:hypothetical protein HQ576_02310, partial [bacterium]|nr:hypothetical protein [bacterium]